MSKGKVSFLVVGLLAIAATVLAIAGTGQLNASSEMNSEMTVASAEGQTASSSCAMTASSCSKTAASSACPATAAAMASAGSEKKGCAASCPASSSCGDKKTKTASLAPIEQREGERIVLVGHYVCGSCDLGVSEKCAAAFQTKSGKNYLLVKNNLTADLKKKARNDDVQIVTVVKRLDGQKRLQVETINPVS
jgi:hypothetical protein